MVYSLLSATNDSFFVCFVGFFSQSFTLWQFIWVFSFSICRKFFLYLAYVVIYNGCFSLK